MKVSNRTWVILLFLVIVAAAAGLYFLYNSQVEKRDNAAAAKQQAQIMIPALQTQKVGLEEDLAGLEEQYASLLQQMEELSLSLELAEEELALSRARLQLMVESIEYGERLFALANQAGVEIASVTVEPPVPATITGITHELTAISLEIKGQNENIFDFVTLVNQDAMFDTTKAGPVNLDIPPVPEPEPYDREQIRQKHYQALLAENLAALSPEAVVDIVQEVTLNMFGTEITDNSLEERIGVIRHEITLEFGIYLADLLAEDIGTLTEQHIAAQLAEKVGVYWGAKIFLILQPEIENILAGTMDTWMGDEIEGALQGDITALIKGHISREVQSDIDELVEPDAAQVEALTQAEVAELERLASQIPIPDSQVTISLEIYNYPG